MTQIRQEASGEVSGTIPRNDFSAGEKDSEKRFEELLRKLKLGRDNQVRLFLVKITLLFGHVPDRFPVNCVVLTSFCY